MGLLSLIGDYFVPFVVILGILVFVHELGHYWVARRCGVRIESFSIGFGPEIVGWNDRSGTRWKVSLLPLGGYVKMFGDADATSARPAKGAPEEDEAGGWAKGRTRPLTEDEKRHSFHHKTVWQRIAIVAGGPGSNFLFAIVILAGFFVFIGQPTTPPVIGSVVADSAAADAGLRAGDRIVAVNGTAIDRFEQIQRIVQINLSAPLDLTVLRDGETISLSARPRLVEAQDPFGNTQQTARLGITASGTEYVRHGPVEAVWSGVTETFDLAWSTLKAVGQMITGARSADDLGGPIRIAEMSGAVAADGIVTVLWFMAVLSINLGLINLFPVPMLDGGHLLFYAVEAVRGRPLGERTQEIGFRIGLALVLSLFVFTTWKDIARLELFSF